MVTVNCSPSEESARLTRKSKPKSKRRLHPVSICISHWPVLRISLALAYKQYTDAHHTSDAPSLTSTGIEAELDLVRY